jgi:hypothetical protein
MNLQGKDDEETSIRCTLGKWSGEWHSGKCPIPSFGIKSHEPWIPLPRVGNYFSELDSEFMLQICTEIHHVFI